MTEKYYKYIDGQLVEMTTSEVDRIKEENQRYLLEELQHDVVTNEELIELILGYYTIKTPDGSEVPVGEVVNQVIDLPFKLGYKWELKFNGNEFLYESVPAPDAIGTSEDNCIIYYEGCPLISNAFYKKDGKIQVYMAGQWAEW